MFGLRRTASAPPKAATNAPELQRRQSLERVSELAGQGVIEASTQLIAAASKLEATFSEMLDHNDTVRKNVRSTPKH